jgi:RND family efflux transporter MFP subunit
MVDKIVRQSVLCFIIFITGSFSGSFVLAMEFEAITRPSEDIMLSFVRGGRVKDVNIREGDKVAKDQRLSSLENEVELLQLKQLESEAKNTAKIELVKIEITQKEKDLEKLEWAISKGAVTHWELDHTKLELKTARISLRQARVENEMTKLRRDEMKAQLGLLTIHSPITGQIEKVQIEPGESSQPLTPVIRVVKVDPLLIDVHVPLSTAHYLEIGHEVVVRTILDNVFEAKAVIKHIALVADAASMTIRVQLELPNPEQLPAGERVRVLF